jgi:hypothetical protein
MIAPERVRVWRHALFRSDHLVWHRTRADLRDRAEGHCREDAAMDGDDGRARGR